MTEEIDSELKRIRHEKSEALLKELRRFIKKHDIKFTPIEPIGFPVEELEKAFAELMAKKWLEDRNRK